MLSNLSIAIFHFLLPCIHAHNVASLSQQSSSALSLPPPCAFQKYCRSKQQPPPMQHGMSNRVRYLRNTFAAYELGVASNGIL
jgi:hypothetical protein